ncbi:MAG TPA: RodZ domain-containing protein [Planktothrix sp.]|jgi:cytoskeletal protein RodZ
MSLDDIGQKLKSAREGQGLTLVQIYERTKIPLHHLQSIDTGNVDDLPEPVYVAGFIKRYADVVGLNGQALSDEYRQDAGEAKSSNGNGHFMRPVKANVAQAVMIPTSYTGGGRSRADAGAPSLMKMIFFPALMAVMVVGLLAILLQYHSYNPNQSDPSTLNLGDAARSFNNTQAAAPTVAPPATNPTQTGTALQATSPANSECSVSITANKHVWVDVKALSTGESVYTGFLESGDRRDYKDPQGVRVHAGNGGSLTVVADGKSAPLGLPGKISEKTYVAKGASATPAAGATGDASKTANGTGSVLGSSTSTKPIVKKPPRKPSSASDGAGRHKYRSIDEAPSRGLPGEMGGSRSTDVPYRYTEGRMDTDQ